LHGLGGSGEEVAAAVEPLAADQAQVRLVDRGGGVEAVAGRLDGQLSGSKSAQLVGDRRQEIGGGLGVAARGGFEQSGDGGHELEYNRCDRRR
jgi:hypothetical protein